MTYEDFTTYTEVDVSDRIQKTAYHIDHVAHSDEEVYLYKDYTLNHFGDFTHKIKFKIVSANTYGEAVHWMLSNHINDMYGLYSGGHTAVFMQIYRTPAGDRWFILREAYSSTLYTDKNINGFNYGDWVYAKIVKSGTSLNCYLYSDADYSVLVDTLNLTLHGDWSFRYLFGCSSVNTGDAGREAVQDVENFDLCEVVPRGHGYIFG